VALVAGRTSGPRPHRSCRFDGLSTLCDEAPCVELPQLRGAGDSSRAFLARRCGAGYDRPPFAGIIGALVALLKGTPYVYNIRDLYPDMAVGGSIVEPGCCREFGNACTAGRCGAPPA